jgi:hypothetical protein
MIRQTYDVKNSRSTEPQEISSTSQFPNENFIYRSPNALHRIFVLYV